MLREYRKQRVGELVQKKNPQTEEERDHATQAAHTTVNRHLSYLRQAYYHGKDEQTPPKVTNVPKFPFVKEDNIRQGFLTTDQYMIVRDALPDYLKPLFITAFFVAIREGELLRIKWPQVDFDRRVIVLERNQTKNKQPRLVPILEGDMLTYLVAAKKERDDLFPACPWVFSRHGEQIIDFREAWTSACQRAGFPTLLFHDLRRTAAKIMRSAGFPESVIMDIGGWKTDSMFRRYAIVDESDVNQYRGLYNGFVRKYIDKAGDFINENTDTISVEGLTPEKRKLVEQMVATLRA